MKVSILGLVLAAVAFKLTAILGWSCRSVVLALHRWRDRSKRVDLSALSPEQIDDLISQATARREQNRED